MLGPLDKKFSGWVGGGGWHCNYSYKLQGPGGILRVDLESNLTVDLDRVRPGPELVNNTKVIVINLHNLNQKSTANFKNVILIFTFNHDKSKFSLLTFFTKIYTKW